MLDLKVATWNIDWVSKRSPKLGPVEERLDEIEADLIVLT